jgi:hypothetical protein
MPEGEQTEPAAGDRAEGATPEPSGEPIVSVHGVVSAVLGALSVAAMALVAMIWMAHRSDVEERRYQSRVLQAAADWTGVLINMNTDNVQPSLQRLHDGTAGELNVDFDSAMQPYQHVVQRLQSRSSGRIEAVAIEAVHPEGAAAAEQLPAPGAARTDTVMVIATSVSKNVGGQPQMVHWNLRLGVSDVDGKLLISRLASVR